MNDRFSAFPCRCCAVKITVWVAATEPPNSSVTPLAIVNDPAPVTFNVPVVVKLELPWTLIVPSLIIVSVPANSVASCDIPYGGVMIVECGIGQRYIANDRAVVVNCRGVTCSQA